MADHEVHIDFVIELARKAGALIKSKMFNRDKALKSKVSAGDLVTETDVACEQMLVGLIKEKFPHHQFLAEESAATGQRVTDAPTWIIDPIDGTTNFVHTFPFACVSIAFCREKEPIIGVIYNPTLDELFVGQKGHGATLNGEPITTSGCTQLGQSLVSTGFGVNMLRKLEKPDLSAEDKAYLENRRSNILKYTSLLMEKVHDIRRIGSSALDICHVAMGRQDIFFEIGPCEWDIAAGLVILKEAGGVSGDFDGGKLELHAHRVVVASTQALYDELYKQILKHINTD